MSDPMKEPQKPKRMSLADAIGIWLLILAVVAFIAYMVAYDPMGLAYTLFALGVLFGIPYVFTRLWNAHLDRRERKHYHAD